MTPLLDWVLYITNSSQRKNFDPSFPAVGRRVIQQVEKHKPLFHQRKQHWNIILNKPFGTPLEIFSGFNFDNLKARKSNCPKLVLSSW